LSIPIIYQDKYLMVVNKPQGLMVEEAARGHLSVIRFLKKEFALGLRGNNILQNVHRLDKPVSGTLLIARKRSVLKILNQQFESREIGKTYLAIVSTPPPSPEGELRHWLMKDDEAKRANIKDTRSPLSVEVRLTYKTLKEKNGKTLLEIDLITGKYHQIRAQLAHIGSPIIGDEKYGSIEKYIDNALALHASKLTFRHPIDGTVMSVVAPTPDDAWWDLFK
jgi:23S rRNA pseudouridine1911/1915/1917 synthase